MNRFATGNALAALQGVHAFFVGAPFLYLFGLTFLDNTDSSGLDRFPIVVGAVGVWALAVILWLRRRPLDTTSLKALVASYRGMFYLDIGVAEVPVLVGFAGFFLTGELSVYLLGMALGLLALALVAPTRAQHPAETAADRGARIVPISARSPDRAAVRVA
ncbi:MAG: hypothetical protein ACRDH0_13915 [Actinomycetota bacterium]